MSKNNLFLLVISSFALFIYVNASNKVVPVFLWEKSNKAPLVPALEKISERSFENILVNHIPDDARVLVFAKDLLSTQDFLTLKSNDHTSNAKLESVKDDNSVSYFPTVHNPVGAIKRLYPDAIKTSLSDALEDESIILNNKVLIFSLDDASENSNFKQQAFKAFDIFEKIAQKYDHVVGLLTGFKGHPIVLEEKVVSRRKRDVVTAGDLRVLYRTDNVLLYVNSTIKFFVNNSEVSIYNGTTFTSTAGDNNVVATLSDTATQITFNYNASNSYWYLTNLTVTYGGTDHVLSIDSVYAPYNFSYTCNKTIFYESGNANVNLSLPGFQTQPFFGIVQNGTFGDPYNCVGFTTIPIWSGLFVTFILALIMTFGLTFMLDMRTMDRFDDPKGKTIIVNVSE